MKDLFKEQILALKSSDIKALINKKVKIYLTRKDFDQQEYVGFIRKICLSNNKPHLPFDINLELDSGDKISLGIIFVNKIEFLK